MGICCAILLALGVLVLSPGITHIRTSVKDPQGAATSFRGLKTLYGDATDTIKLLVVHGMGDHTVGYSRELTDGLQDRLNLQFDHQDPDEDLDGGLPPGAPHAVLRRLYYGDKTRHLVVFEVTWAPLLRALKKELLLDFEAQHESERALINRHLKATLVNDSLSDPVMYLGDSGPYIRNAVKQTLCRMVNGKLEGKVNEEICRDPRLEQKAVVAMVTFSLGSKITFDSVNDLEQQENQQPAAGYAMRQLLGSTMSVYMLANQLPLLALAAPPRQPPPAAGGAPSLAAPAPGAAPALVEPQAARQRSSLYHILDSRKRLRQTPSLQLEAGLKRELGPLEVVTISDPNDLLSYPLPPWLAKEFPDDKLVNVTTLIAWRFLSGTASNPVQAHTGHVHSKKVMKMLVDGKSS